MSEKLTIAEAKAAAKRDELAQAAEEKFGEREAQKTFAALDDVRHCLSRYLPRLLSRAWCRSFDSHSCLVHVMQKGRGVVVFEQFRRWWAAGGSTVTPPASPTATDAEPEPFDGGAPSTAAADAGAADGGAAAIPEGVPPFHGPSEEQVARAQAMWLKEDPGDGGVNIETFMCDATQSLIPTQPALS